MIDTKQIVENRYKGVAPEGFVLILEKTIQDLQDFEIWKEDIVKEITSNGDHSSHISTVDGIDIEPIIKPTKVANPSTYQNNRASNDWSIYKSIDLNSESNLNEILKIDIEKVIRLTAKINFAMSWY